MDDRAFILNNIFSNGKLKHFALKKYWYEANNLMDVYHKIFEITSFLNDYDDVCMRERIHYIYKNLNDVVHCPYCNTKLKYNKSKKSFRTHCGSTECRSIHTSITSRKMWDEFSTEKIRQRNAKISESRKNNPIQYTDGIIEKMRVSATGRVFSKETNEKRIKTRRINNKVWHSDDVKAKISESNKNNFKNDEFYNNHIERVRKSSDKISKTMKDKIVSGEFTPPITNSWTRCNSYVNYNGGVRKFRSSWECVFWLSNKKLKYESIRIPYINGNGDSKIYIVDFVDEENKILYEIKPNATKNNKNNLLKEHFANEWSDENGYKYFIISDDWFKRNIHSIDFSNNEHLLEPMRQFL